MRIKDNAKESNILNTALNMIVEEGLVGLKMGELAKRSGVATGTLYIYYPSKDAIIYALYDFVVKELYLDLMEGIDPEQPIKTRLKLVAQNYIKEFLAFPQYRIFIQQYRRSPYPQERTGEMLDICFEPVKDLFKQAMDSGLIKIVDTHLLGAIYQSTFDGYCWHIHALNKSSFDQEEFEQVFEIIWNGIAKH